MKRVRDYSNGLYVPARIVSVVNFSDSPRNIVVPDRSKYLLHTTGRWAETQTGTDLNHLCLPTRPSEAQIPIVKNSRYADYFVMSVPLDLANPRFDNESTHVNARFLNWPLTLCGGTT